MAFAMCHPRARKGAPEDDTRARGRRYWPVVPVFQWKISEYC
jgi:hypothetical protein